MSSSRHESSGKKKFSPKQKWGGKRHGKEDEQRGRHYAPSAKKHAQPSKLSTNRKPGERSGEWQPRRDSARGDGRRRESFSESSSYRKSGERSGEWQPRRDSAKGDGRRRESFSESSSYRKSGERTDGWKPRRDSARGDGRRRESFSESSSYQTRNGDHTSWKKLEDVKNPSSKRKQERENYSQKMKPKVGYFSKDGRDSDDSGSYRGGRWRQPHSDKRKNPDSPGWMPKRSDAKTEIKGERTRGSSTSIEDKQRRTGRSNPEQRPKGQYQKKDWKERSEGYSRGDKRRKRDYSRGDNPSRRIRPPT